MLVGDGQKRWYFRKVGTVDLAGTVSKTVLETKQVVLKDRSMCDQEDAWLFGGNSRMGYWFGSIQCESDELQNKTQQTQNVWNFIADSTKLEIVTEVQVSYNSDRYGGYASSRRSSTENKTIIWELKRLTDEKLHIRSVSSFKGGDSIRIEEHFFEHGL